MRCTSILAESGIPPEYVLSSADNCTISSLRLSSRSMGYAARSLSALDMISLSDSAEQGMIGLQLDILKNYCTVQNINFLGAGYDLGHSHRLLLGTAEYEIFGDVSSSSEEEDEEKEVNIMDSGAEEDVSGLGSADTDTGERTQPCGRHRHG